MGLDAGTLWTVYLCGNGSHSFSSHLLEIGDGVKYRAIMSRYLLNFNFYWLGNILFKHLKDFGVVYLSEFLVFTKFYARHKAAKAASWLAVVSV